MKQDTGFERRDDIDWLRVLAMAAVFLFHCARFFDFDDWHVKNARLSEGMSVFVGVLVQWIMPFFFLLSGMSTRFALRARSGGRFLAARVKRLAVPFLFGTLVHIPLQVYFERLSHFQFEGSYFAFYPRYFDGLYAFGGNFAWMGLHLWYLEVLFIFSLLTLPLFLFLRGESGQKFLSKTAGWLSRSAALFLLAVPLVLMEILTNLQPDGIGRRDFGGWSLLTYLVFFLNGYLIASDKRIFRAIEKLRWGALVIGGLTLVSGYVLLESGISSRSVGISILRGFHSWIWLLAFLGLGSRFLRFRNRFLAYAGEAVLPFYILHQTVIVTLGYFLIGWETAVLGKYLFLAASSFVIIVLIYEAFVRRINVLRFLFGMKKNDRKSPRPSRF